MLTVERFPEDMQNVGLVWTNMHEVPLQDYVNKISGEDNKDTLDYNYQKCSLYSLLFSNLISKIISYGFFYMAKLLIF